jgi:hypothetical protein
MDHTERAEDTQDRRLRVLKRVAVVGFYVTLFAYAIILGLSGRF